MNNSAMDQNEDPNCHVHFVAPNLPEPLPQVDQIERRFSTLTNNYIKTVQWSDTGNYMVKRDKNNLMEAWTMLYLRNTTSIPVPTVYAILTNKSNKHNIIIMEYIPHQSLDKAWSSLTAGEKEDTAKQLATYFAELRTLPSLGFFGRSLPPEFGNLDKGPLPDFLFTPFAREKGFGGPFETIEQLGKGLGDSMKGNDSAEPERREFYNRLIPMILDEGPPVFTHGDIQLRNLIRKDGKVIIIDWGLCGWYPAWWEYCYTVWAADFTTDWPAYIPKFLSEYPKELCLTLILRTMWCGSIV